jgi:hypothetical protein
MNKLLFLAAVAAIGTGYSSETGMNEPDSVYLYSGAKLDFNLGPDFNQGPPRIDRYLRIGKNSESQIFGDWIIGSGKEPIKRITTPGKMRLLYPDEWEKIVDLREGDTLIAPESTIVEYLKAGENLSANIAELLEETK